MTKVDLARMRGTLMRALEAGQLEVIGPTTFHWDVSGDCQDARGTTLEARPCREQWLPLSWGWDRPLPSAVRLIDESGAPAVLTMHVRCRACPACLRHRSNMWAARAAWEVAASVRTWFGTLTGSPATHNVWLTRARRGHKGDWDLLTPGERFERHGREMQRELTLFLKRVRKRTGTKFRYLLVIEAHTEKLAGYPHAHMLLHETADRVLYDDLRDEWKRMGFSNFRLVEDKTQPEFKRVETAAWYACKYLTKGLQARVRASLRYGQINHLSDSSMTLNGPPNVPCDPPPYNIKTGITGFDGGSGVVRPPSTGVSPGPSAFSGRCAPCALGVPDDTVSDGLEATLEASSQVEDLVFEECPF